MAPFPFLQRESLSDLARQLSLTGYSPTLELSGLLAGIDNVRHDVFLSPTFAEVVRLHVQHLIAVYGSVEDLVTADAPQIPQIAPPSFLWGKGEPPQPVPKPGADPADFKRMLTDLMILALNWAKAESNLSLDLLARLAVIKLLRTELTAQYNGILERLRAKVAKYESPRQANIYKGVEFRERCAAFQLAKGQLLRKASQELFQTLREVEKEALARMRRALFGGVDHPAYSLLLNRLMFSEGGRDDSINAEHYVMLGNFDSDPDRFSTLQEIARVFLASLDLPTPEGQDHVDLDALLNMPDNAQELVAGGSPDESGPKGRAQKALLAAWTDTLERNGVMAHIIAAYEAAPLLAEYSPTIHAQQLKNALINRTECTRVERMLEEHSRFSPANFEAALRRLDNYRAADRAKLAGRFFRDFMRYHRDLRSLEVLNRALDAVHLISNQRLRELSSINNTLYEFLLPQEQKPAEEKVINHVILKADVRDSTTLTRTLMERGLNPASYFSLNFYEPVNKLLPKYQATKVFIEGDAVILALFGYEGRQEFPVARTCVLAREIISIVRAYNDKSREGGLPNLELGIGISFQASAPMYLMDGNARIMISKALNESDRLSSCNKGARRCLADVESLFNVYSFKTVEDEDTGGNPDEFLMRYNVGGININDEAFRDLQQEISLQLHEVELPTLWGKGIVRIYSGLVPLGGGSFHRIVVREGRIPRIDASDFSVKSWTDRQYYEVCTNEAIYEYIEAHAAPTANSAHTTGV
ncbi:MAG: hypothetical protein LAN64_10775 [Acidobacteriia bacterium]|nr:hypothetical protein [Terriglobia bacterium]